MCVAESTFRLPLNSGLQIGSQSESLLSGDALLAESKLEADHVTRWNAAWKLRGVGCYIKHGMLVIYRENENNGNADSIVVPGGL